MSKSHKIKRYSKIYQKRNSKIKLLKIIACVVVALALLVGGWFWAKPHIMSFLENNSNPQTESMPTKDDSNDDGSAITNEEELLKAVVLSADVLQEANSIDTFIFQAKNDGYTAIMVEFKDNNGILYYQSALSQVKGTNIVSTSAVDAKELCSKIESAGLKPMAKIHAFKDIMSPNVSNDNTYRYNDTTTIWLDNSYNAGGKPWLNPFRQAAREYIIAIAEEIVDAGFKTIEIDSIQFPNVSNMSNAGLGDQNTNESKAAILKQFVQEMTTAIEAKEATVFIGVEAGAFLGYAERQYAMTEVDMGAKNYAVLLDLSTLPEDISVEGTAGTLSIQNIVSTMSAEDMAANTEEILKYIVNLRSSAEVLPVLYNQTQTSVKVQNEDGTQTDLQNYIIVQ